MMLAYEWKAGSRIGIDAQTVGAAVEDIEGRDGVCTPAALVNAARPKRSPIHPLFEWRDDVAAGKWRTHQARNVLNQLRIRVNESDEPVPAFVRVTADTEADTAAGYMNVVQALAGDHRDAVLQDALRQLNGVRRRYQSLQELSQVWAALDKIAA